MERIAGIAFVEDGRSAPIVVDVSLGRERPQLFLSQASQERYVPDQFFVGVVHSLILAC